MESAFVFRGLNQSFEKEFDYDAIPNLPQY